MSNTTATAKKIASKSIQVTSKTSHNIPTSAFTLADYLAVNPSVKQNTAYQRIKAMVSDGVIQEVGGVKREEGKRGRDAMVYKLPEASDKSNLMRKVISQGRLKPVATVESPASDATDTSAPVEDSAPESANADATVAADEQ